jgi:putative Holliday junction resolvase
MTYPVILAIDYGLKRIGLAISRATLAEPLLTLENTDNLLGELRQIIVDEQVEQLLVGVSENEMADKSTAFAERLRSEFELPVELTDETLSSKSVLMKIKNDKLKHLKPGMPIDHLAAAEFLQEYLDFHL